MNLDTRIMPYAISPRSLTDGMGAAPSPPVQASPPPTGDLVSLSSSGMPAPLRPPGVPGLSPWQQAAVKVCLGTSALLSATAGLEAVELTPSPVDHDDTTAPALSLHQAPNARDGALSSALETARHEAGLDDYLLAPGTSGAAATHPHGGLGLALGLDTPPTTDPLNAITLPVDMPEGHWNLRLGLEQMGAPLEAGYRRAEGIWNDLARERTMAGYQAEVGDYHLKMDFGATQVQVEHRGKGRARLDEQSLTGRGGIQADFNLVSAELSHKDELGGSWSSTHGVRGGVFSSFEDLHAYTVSTHRENSGMEHEQSLNVSGQAEVFQTWQGPVGSWGVLTLSHSLGARYDAINDGVTLYQENSQSLAMDLSNRVPWLGDHLKGEARLNEGIAMDPRSGHVNPHYEALAELSKKFPLQIMGKERTLEVEAGVRVRGDADRPFDVGPTSGVRLRW